MITEEEIKQELIDAGWEEDKFGMWIDPMLPHCKMDMKSAYFRNEKKYKYVWGEGSISYEELSL